MRIIGKPSYLIISEILKVYTKHNFRSPFTLQYIFLIKNFLLFRKTKLIDRKSLRKVIP